MEAFEYVIFTTCGQNFDSCGPMGKEQELIDAARSGNIATVERYLSQRAKRSGPLARWVESIYVSAQGGKRVVVG